MKTIWNERFFSLVLRSSALTASLFCVSEAQVRLEVPAAPQATLQRLENVATQPVFQQSEPAHAELGRDFYSTAPPPAAPPIPDNSPGLTLPIPEPADDLNLRTLVAPVGIQRPAADLQTVDRTHDADLPDRDLTSAPANPAENQLALSSTSDGTPWWRRNVQSSLRPTQNQLRISLNALLVGALSNSAQVQLISDAPLIAETEISMADAAFDWVSFMDARWDDISEPVGSTLITGGPERLRDHTVSFEGGVRRRNTLGGEFEIGQRIGHQNSNSVFFLPQDQGTSRLTLSYTQPLLRGAGKVYNTSLTVLAKLKTKLERDEFERQLQEHLLTVTQEYWNLYFERAKYLQQQRLLQNGISILEELDSRKEIDALQSQIVRAKAAVENRRAQLVRTRLSIRMAEARIRSLVNDPSLGGTLAVELIPMESPTTNRTPSNLEYSIQEALQHRPEVDAAIQQVKSASVRMNMGKRETLPLLNVVLETYASGLEGRSNIGRALNEQVTQGEPSYGIGLQYEYPIWNRAANSKLQKRRLELRRLQHQFRQTVETLKLEVELAVHQVDAAYESLGAKRKAMEAAAAEVAYLFDRWQLLPVDNGSASLLLEDLLEAQDRLADAELGLLQSLVDHNLASVGLKKSVGTLLSEHQVTIDRNCNCNLPQQEIRAATLPSPFTTLATPQPAIEAEWPVEEAIAPEADVHQFIPDTPVAAPPPVTLGPTNGSTEKTIWSEARARFENQQPEQRTEIRGYPSTHSRSAWSNRIAAKRNEQNPQ